MNFSDVTDKLAQQFTDFFQGALGAAPSLVSAALAILITWGVVAIVRRVVQRLGKRLHLRSNLVDVLTKLTSMGLWLVGLLMALTIVFPSITPGKALTTLGLGSVAIGFAFKDTFENFLAGILILLREPFQIGDFIECEGIEGKIEEITIRDSHVRKTDGQLVVVPNHALFQNPVVVRTDRDLRRTTVICGVSYDTDVDHARDVILAAVKRVDTVRDDIKDVQLSFDNGIIRKRPRRRVPLARPKISRLCGYAKLEEDRGPATNQAMNPTMGKIRTSSIHSTLLPVDAPDPMIETIAQMLSPKTISPPRIHASTSCSTSSLVRPYFS